MLLGFEWNDRKARTNLQKHGVDFVEAASVFSDPLARIFLDEGHSAGELREIIIGRSSRKRLLLICFTEPEKERIRIISARSATRREQRDYEEEVTN
jgi:uncharacterized DUF497 family protein